MAFVQGWRGIHSVGGFLRTSIIGLLYPLFRFLFVVLGTYKQIRNQSANVMSDVDEDNFDRAFDILRPGKRSQGLA